MISAFFQRYGFLLWTLITIAWNAFIEYFKVWGETSATVSDRLYTIITPAWFTFSIRSVIYAALTIVGVLIAMKRININLKATSIYLLSCLANILRLVVWHYELISLSVWVIVVLLFSLIRFIEYIKTRGLRHSTLHKVTLLYFWRVMLATLICVTSYLTYFVPAFSPYVLPRAVSCIALAWLLNILIIIKEKTILTAAVFLWAMYWIASVHSNTNILTAIHISSLAVLLTVLWFIINWFSQKKKNIV